MQSELLEATSHKTFHAMSAVVQHAKSLVKSVDYERRQMFSMPRRSGLP